jgi:hypothetical protein
MHRTEVATPAVPTTMNIEKAHRLLGHQSEDATRKTAKHLGWNITSGTVQTCLPCTIGKAKQKNTQSSQVTMSQAKTQASEATLTSRRYAQPME